MPFPDDETLEEDGDVAGEPDDESGSEYDSEDSFFEQNDGEPPPDEYDEERERRLTGMSPTRCFRWVPNAHLERLLEASARAAACMPKLQTMAAGADIQPSERTDYNLQNFEFEFLASGLANPKDQEIEDAERPRLYWTVPKGWRMSEQLEELWMAVIGGESSFGMRSGSAQV